jgi:hypothetical protein
MTTLTVSTLTHFNISFGTPTKKSSGVDNWYLDEFFEEYLSRADDISSMSAD